MIKRVRRFGPITGPFAKIFGGPKKRVVFEREHV
jgi:hypothetical protein